ncbi:MAG TPA: glycosyltransferase family 4 protein [Acidimicrobiales bacterium]|nr:glycosyltransferase family 4 protein [Acidimicrobiales bacterium]
MVRTRLLTVAGELSAIGGTEIAQLRVIEGLASMGWAIELLYVSRGDLWPRWNELASSTRAIRPSGLRRAAPLRSSFGALSATNAIMHSDAQVVYLHNPGDLPSALMASWVKRTPVAVHLHLPPPFRQPGWLNRLIRRADAVITPSSDAATRWIRVAGLSRDRVSVIPTGIDTEQYVPIADVDRAEQRRALGIDPSVPMVLYAGRVDVTKGVAYLLEALRHMSQRANLVVCGTGADPDFVSMVRNESRDMGVTWLDRRLDVTSLLATADLVVVPSLVYETQGMVAIEAMSCGTPVVASAVGGLPETLVAFPEHLVPPGDAVALARGIDRLVGWRQHSPTLGDDSRRWAADHLALERTVRAISELLSSLEP